MYIYMYIYGKIRMTMAPAAVVQLLWGRVPGNKGRNNQLISYAMGLCR